VVATFSALALRLFIQTSVQPYFGSIAGGGSNAIVILILNIVWSFVARKLNDWENYRTESEYLNNLTFKIFAFYFVNSYTCLYYLAFIKNGFYVFYAETLADACRSGNLVNNIISHGCPDEVSLQLAIVLVVNMFVGQAQEIALPWVKTQVQFYLLKRETDESLVKGLPVWERDSKKDDFDGILSEYAEMVIQYGYITLFAALFPPAPLLAVINNIVEIRTDAFKITNAVTRPRYRGAQNIGTWYYILEFLGIVAVITNCTLIGISFELIYLLTYENVVGTICIALLLEHILLAMKFGIAYLIPDLPGWIVKKVAFEEFVKESTLKQILLKNHIKPEFVVDDNAEEDDDPTSPPPDDKGVPTIPLSSDKAAVPTEDKNKDAKSGSSSESEKD